MLRAIIWRDLRWRLLASLLLVLPFALMTSWSHTVSTRRASASGMQYVDHLDVAWFQVPGPNALFVVVAVILSVSGSLVGPRNDIAYVLSLPITRSRWLFAHIAASLTSLAAIVMIVGAVLAAGAWIVDTPANVGALLLRMLGTFLAGSVLVAATYGVLTVLRHPLLTAIAVLGMLAVMPGARFRFQNPADEAVMQIPMWDPWAFVDPRMWETGLPLMSMSVAIVTAVFATTVVMVRVNRADF